MEPRKGRTKRSSTLAAILLAGLAALATAALGTAAAQERPAGSTEARPAAVRRVTAARGAANRQTRAVPFSTDKTDDFLCRHVSAFFCTSVFPTASTAPPPAQNNRSRSRG